MSLLTSKLLAVDRFASSAVVLGEVAALQHELNDGSSKSEQDILAVQNGTHLGNDAVEPRTCVSIAVLACAELAEVTGCLWDDVIEQLEGYPTGRLFGDGDIEL